MEIRAARDQADLDEVWGLLQRTFDLDDEERPRWSGPHQADSTLVAVLYGAVIGCIQVHEHGQYFGGRPVPMASSGALAVRPEERRSGVGSRLMIEAIARARERGAAISVIRPGTFASWRRLGWEVAGMWSEQAVPVRSLQRLDGGFASDTDVRPALEDDLGDIASLHEQWVVKDNGRLLRSSEWWHGALTGETDEPLEALVARSPSGLDGYALFESWPEHGARRIVVREVVATTRNAFVALWHHVAGLARECDEVRTVWGAEDPLLHLLDDPDLTLGRLKRWMLRLIDAPSAVSARGYAPVAHVDAFVELEDAHLPGNSGRWRLQIERGAGCLAAVADGTRPETTHTVKLGVGAFSSLFSSYSSATSLARLGLAEGPPGLLASLDEAFSGPMPWMSDVL